MNLRQELLEGLRCLNLTTMSEQVEEAALRAAKESLTHETFLLELVRMEQAAKHGRRVERLLKQSGLLPTKTFTSLQLKTFSPAIQMQIERLRDGNFIHDAVNVIAVGQPGSGKSHLACALGRVLIDRGIPVFFCSTASLVQRLLVAKRDLRLPQEIAKLDRFDCLILDDIGYVQHDQDEMEVLFTLLAERYERKSVIITTNLVFSEWNQIFKNPLTTLAAIDRVVHHSIILDLMNVPSYRAKAAVSAKAKMGVVTGIAAPALAAAT
jgi:DNA replication protein DnaC